ncbi:MAG: hypothetical protein JNK07_20260 [Alphaproteobacteria bacterium]|nr:hypothetical protein [Alphaproteobacteria bacterium]
MNRTVSIALLAALAIAMWQGYAISSTMSSCLTRAHAIIADADTLDRNPPKNVIAAIVANVGLDKLPSMLASVLFDRYACRGGANWAGVDWLIERPILIWRLRSEFDEMEMVAIFAATADLGKGTIGLSNGARRIYKREISELDDRALNCLLRRPIGKALHRPTPDPVPPIWDCPDEAPRMRS